jgi:DNA-binding PadR family transcriptional regulator
MQEPTFLILTSLAGGPAHGYAILKEIEEITDGQVRMRAGTLYAALERLMDEHLVSMVSEGIVDNRLRRYYRLSAKGAEQLSAEADRLNKRAKLARTRLRTNLMGGPA